MISGNTNGGIYITGTNATGNVLQGNFIGTDASGDLAVPNGSDGTVAVSQNTGVGGLYVLGAHLNTLGGTMPGAGNLISGNFKCGILIRDAGAYSNIIQGNLIGTKTDGASPLGNQWSGIELGGTTGYASNNIIGGAVAGAGNVIAFAQVAGYDGIRIRDITTSPGNVGNLIRGNSIFSNGVPNPTGLGIDLGPTGWIPSASAIPIRVATRGNLLQNFPILSFAYSGSATWIRGTLDSAANKTYLLQFYANKTPSISGCGEGQTYLGDGYVTTGANCTGEFTTMLPIVVPPGQYVTATATDPANNTSEFCTNVVVSLQPSLSVSYPASSGQTSQTNQVTLSWTTNAASGVQLQETTNLNPQIVWTDVTNAPFVTNGQFVVILPPTQETGFTVWDCPDFLENV